MKSNIRPTRYIKNSGLSASFKVSFVNLALGIN